MLYKKSGLLGVSGLSNDMRTLRDAAGRNPAAAEAIALFTYRIIRDIGSLAAALGGLDALVFTAGIGENDAELRADVIEGLGFLGLRLDGDANRAGKTLITTADGPVGLVIPTNEEIMIARETAALI
jgi:acetate kinase